MRSAPPSTACHDPAREPGPTARREPDENNSSSLPEGDRLSGEPHRTHDRYRELIAAYVVGGLDPSERAELDVHLGRCQPCRGELVELAPLPALLRRVTPGDLDGVDGGGRGADAVVGAVRAEVAGLGRSRRWWRLTACVAVACLAVVAVASGAVLSGDDGHQRRGVALNLESVAAGSWQVVADERPWGTYLHLSAEQVPARDRSHLWVVDHDDAWHPAGAWSATPDASVRRGASTALALADIDRVVVTSRDRDDQLVVAR